MDMTRDRRRFDVAVRQDAAHWLRSTREWAAAAGAGPVPEPMQEPEAIDLFLKMGYVCNERVIELMLGGRADLYTAADLMCLHKWLEEKRMWRPWPNGYHDPKKSCGQLALEIAEAWPRLSDEERAAWIDAWPPVDVLQLCIGCVDKDAMKVWGYIAGRKFQHAIWME